MNMEPVDMVKLTVFTKMFNCHHLTPGHFCHPRKKYPGPTSSHSALPFCPWQPQLYFWFLWIYLLWTFHTGDIKQCGLCDWLLSCHIFKVHLCCSTITSIHFYILFIYSSVDGSFGTQWIALAMNIHAQFFVWMCIFISLG